MKRDRRQLAASAHFTVCPALQHVKSANRQRKTVLNKQEAATAKYTRGQLAAERGYDSAARVPVRMHFMLCPTVLCETAP